MPDQLSFDFLTPANTVRTVGAEPGLQDAGPVQLELFQPADIEKSTVSVENDSPQAPTNITKPRSSVATSLPEPIEYTLIVSKSARRVYLRVEQGRGLLVTIPKRYPKREIPALLESQRSWIMESLQEIDERTPEIYRQWPPERLALSAINTDVDIKYVPTQGGPDSVCWVSANELHVSVTQQSRPVIATAIATALKMRAKSVLTPWLAMRASEHGLSYKRLSIRGQRTLWGSYSSSGTLSLNYKLLFLPTNVVDYVLLHELAHTKHLDHSQAFWQFLEQLKPGAHALDAQLHEAGRLVPPWLELAGKA